MNEGLGNSEVKSEHRLRGNKKKCKEFGKPHTQWLSSKESACNAGYLGNLSSVPGLGRSPGEGNGNPLQYSYLENPMERVAWELQSSVAESDTTEQRNTHSP